MRLPPGLTSAAGCVVGADVTLVIPPDGFETALAADGETALRRIEDERVTVQLIADGVEERILDVLRFRRAGCQI